MAEVASDGDRLDAETLTQIVSARLGRAVSTVHREAEEQLLGGGSGVRLLRLRGTAETDAGTATPWSVVIKYFTPEHDLVQSRSDEPAGFDYWKREWCLYQSGWHRQWSGPLRAARAYGAGEYLDGRGTPAGWVALEDLGVLERRWPISRFRLLARHAGQFNGWSLTADRRRAESWLPAAWLAGYTEAAGAAVAQLSAARTDPLLGRIVSPGYADDIQRLWDMRESAFAALAALPQPLCHNDLFTRNVRTDETTGESIAVDWAFCGAGAVGQELSALVGSSAVFLDSDPTDWATIEQEALEAYAAGLDDAGWRSDETDVRSGYLIALSLRYAIAALPALAGMTLYPEYHDQVAAVLGCRYDDFVDNSVTFCAFVHERLQQALTLLTGRLDGFPPRSRTASGLPHRF